MHGSFLPSLVRTISLGSDAESENDYTLPKGFNFISTIGTLIMCASSSAAEYIASRISLHPLHKAMISMVEN